MTNISNSKIIRSNEETRKYKVFGKPNIITGAIRVNRHYILARPWTMRSNTNAREALN